MPYKDTPEGRVARRANQRRFYERHKDRLREQNRVYTAAYRAANREAISHRQREWHAEHRDEINAAKSQRRKAWYSANPAHVEVPDLDGEEWRPVVGYETHYLVSNMGRVKRIHRGAGTKIGHVLRASLSVGYPHLALNVDGVAYPFFVHRLVADAFICPRPGDLHVNHIDGCKTNNRPENLEWVTPPENVRHSKEHGLTPSGARHGRVRLTADQVRAIRTNAEQLTNRQWAQQCGVAISTVQHARTGRSWNHLTVLDP